jgi:hypothetical protein
MRGYCGRCCPIKIEDKIMKPKTKAKVTACLLTMMAPTIASHASEGIQHTDWSMMRDASTKTVEKPKAVVANTGGLGKKIVCRTGDLQAESLADLLRQLGYRQDEVWGRTNKLEWAWYRVNNSKFKRGEPVEFEGRIFIKNSI